MDLVKGTINDAKAAAKELIDAGQKDIQTDLTAIEALVRRLIEGYVITVQAVPKVKK